MSAQPPAAEPPKKLLQSNVTKFVLGLLAAHILMALAPMLKAHAVDLWALGEIVALDLGALLLNAFRSDIDAGGIFNMLGPKAPKP